MDLLEIIKIISVEKMHNPYNYYEYRRVTAEVYYNGHKKIITHLFLIDEWEQVKKEGHFVVKQER